MFKPRNKLRGRLAARSTITFVQGNTLAQNLPQGILRVENATPGLVFTLYTAVSQIQGTIGGLPINPQNGPPTPRASVMAQIGGGSPDLGSDVIVQRTIAGVPIRLSGSNIQIAWQLTNGDQGGNPFNPSTYLTSQGDTLSVTLTAFLSPGDAQEQRPSVWYIPAAPLQSSENHANGPGRLLKAQGFASAANAATRYLMFFDWPPSAGAVVNGTEPLFSFPVPAGVPFSWDAIETTRAFQYGLAWCVSSTADTLTQSTDTMRVDLEFAIESGGTGF